MTTVGGWKTRIASTMHTTSRMNDLLNENMSLMSLGKKKNLSRIKDAMQAETATVATVESATDSVTPNTDTKKLSADQMYRIIEETIYEQLNEEKFFATYNSQISSKFCQILSREIIRRIKLLNQSRQILDISIMFG